MSFEAVLENSQRWSSGDVGRQTVPEKQQKSLSYNVHTSQRTDSYFASTTATEFVMHIKQCFSPSVCASICLPIFLGQK